MFIYTNDKKSKETLEKHGYSLLKSFQVHGDDTEADGRVVWVFLNDGILPFEEISASCVLSDKLTF